MRKQLFVALLTIVCQGVIATTAPLQETVVSPADPHIQYVGRICFANPERPAFNYPGIQITASFEGTSLKMKAKPGSGYFMAQIDQAEPFKVSFMGKKDSVVTLATALPNAQHTVRLMYAIEGYELYPEFWGFVIDPGCHLLKAPAQSERKIEFIGNSITCGYGIEGESERDHFEYDTENHYYSYASLTAQALDAQHWVVARSGIGAYRNYGGPRAGTPNSNMPVQYEYTGYALKLDLRKNGGIDGERWDFSRCRPDVICINLGTNDLSTNNYDTTLLKQGYHRLLMMVRQHNPEAKIVFLCGSMLDGKELEIARRLLDEVTVEARKSGDKQLYRFDFTPQTGDLGYGSDWHPSLLQHQKMAAELTAFLSSLMNWF